MKNIVAIVGRPNVGKSTLFNRLVEQKQAIVHDVSGVTRDRNYGTSEWNGKIFTVIDTGGFVKDSDDVFEAAIRTQVEIAIEEADVILFMVDVATGITDLDSEMADLLRRSKKDVMLLVNKVDNHHRMLEANEFWSFGFDNTFFLSSISGSGTGELLDLVAEKIDNVEPLSDNLPRFAVVGQPNAGKSSFINALLGEERAIVTEIAGTTRDSFHTKYNKFGMEFWLIDTAGIRKKARVHEDLEFYSVMRAVRAIEDADVCILMIDAVAGIEAQDMSIFRLAQRRNKGIVILINKWDLMVKETNTLKEYQQMVTEKIAPMRDVPIVFISALDKQRIFKSVEIAQEVFENKYRKIATRELNDALEEILAKNPPPTHRGRSISIKYATQIPARSPAFAFFCNHPKHIPENYKQYLENQMRERFNFAGVPVTIFFRQK